MWVESQNSNKSPDVLRTEGGRTLPCEAKQSPVNAQLSLMFITHLTGDCFGAIAPRNDIMLVECFMPLKSENLILSLTV
jgi:hypothetical protein